MPTLPTSLQIGGGFDITYGGTPSVEDTWDGTAGVLQGTTTTTGNLLWNKQPIQGTTSSQDHRRNGTGTLVISATIASSLATTVPAPSGAIKISMTATGPGTAYGQGAVMRFGPIFFKDTNNWIAFRLFLDDSQTDSAEIECEMCVNGAVDITFIKMDVRIQHGVEKTFVVSTDSVGARYQLTYNNQVVGSIHIGDFFPGFANGLQFTQIGVYHGTGDTGSTSTIWQVFTANTDVTVTAPVATATAATQQTTIEVSVSPSAATATSAAPAPTQLSSTIEVSVATATSAAPAPTPVQTLALSAATGNVTATAVAPIVISTIEATVATATAVAYGAVTERTIPVPAGTASSTAYASSLDVVLPVSAATSTATAPAPDLSTGALLAPVATATSAAPQPTIIMTMVPSTATATSAAPAPAIVTGSAVVVQPPVATATSSAGASLLITVVTTSAAQGDARADTPAISHTIVASTPDVTSTAPAPTLSTQGLVQPPVATAFCAAPRPTLILDKWKDVFTGVTTTWTDRLP